MIGGAVSLFSRNARVATFDDSMPDEVLAMAARDDAEAFALLYERYRAAIYAFVLARLANPADAEDVTSQVFTKALAAMPRYREGSFRGWLYQIARNAIVDYQRRATRDVPLEPDRYSVAMGQPVDERIDRVHLRTTIESALAGLTPLQRQVVSLRLHGLSTVQIAAKLGLSIGAVKSAQHRAFCTLESLLEERP